MNWEKINSVYFLGIGGIGMSALARYFLSRNLMVSGYDRTPSTITKALENEGAKINFKDSVSEIDKNSLLNENTLIIYTPAIPKNNQIFIWLNLNKKKLFKRSEILGELSKNYQTIGIAGTHGKTTVSTMTAHIMNNSQIGCQAFLGGISKNYSSNLISHPTSNWMVVEADEYDRSFLQLFPKIGLITAMDADHLDIYGSHEILLETFIQYTEQINITGNLIINYSLKKYFEKGDYYTYDLSNTEADFHVTNIQLHNHQYFFNLVHPKGVIENIFLGMPGLINLENAVASSSAALIAGADPKEIKEGLQTFLGINRRMELIIKNNSINYYDDYAHHPEEIKAAITSIKALYPNTPLTVVFQPHLFSRTKDFAPGFAKSLDLADEVVLLDIYPAREEPIAGIDSNTILDLMKQRKRSLKSKEELIGYLKASKPKLLLTLGAGDIDRLVEPIKSTFE